MLRVGGDAVILSLGGVGLRIEMPTPDLSGLRGEVTVFTVLAVKEDDVRLYGFASERGRELFGTLTSVTGVGPRLGLAILSYHPPERLEQAIVAGDADALALVSGVGRKIAQRIVLELKDKLGIGEAVVATGALAEVRDALRSLGYTPQEVQDAVSSLPGDGDAPTLLRHALRALGARETAGVDA